jgi:hypothetical protein
MSTAPIAGGPSIVALCAIAEESAMPAGVCSGPTSCGTSEGIAGRAKASDMPNSAVSR